MYNVFKVFKLWILQLKIINTIILLAGNEFKIRYLMILCKIITLNPYKNNRAHM